MLLIMALAGWTLTCAAQEMPEVHVDRRIYLWDVTKSMQGYNGAPDIWDNVTTFIKKDIQNISDESTELVVLPFQKKILAEWTVKATQKGKAEMMRHIDGAKQKFDTVTYTNISGLFKQTMDKHIDPSRNNLVILLTDGNQSDIYGGQQAWRNLLSEWHGFAKENNAYMIYLMLTQAAEDEKIKNTLNQETGDVVSPDEPLVFEFMDVYPAQQVESNITESADWVEIHIPLEKSKKGQSMPDGVRMAVRSEPDAPIAVDEETEVVKGAVKDELVVRLKYSVKELKDIMYDSETMSVPLTLELLNRAEIQQEHNKRLILKRNRVELVLINKIEKRLTIKLKR